MHSRLFLKTYNIGALKVHGSCEQKRLQIVSSWYQTLIRHTSAPWSIHKLGSHIWGLAIPGNRNDFGKSLKHALQHVLQIRVFFDTPAVHVKFRTGNVSQDLVERVGSLWSFPFYPVAWNMSSGNNPRCVYPFMDVFAHLDAHWWGSSLLVLVS